MYCNIYTRHKMNFEGWDGLWLTKIATSFAMPQNMQQLEVVHTIEGLKLLGDQGQNKDSNMYVYYQVLKCRYIKYYVILLNIVNLTFTQKQKLFEVKKKIDSS